MLKIKYRTLSQSKKRKLAFCLCPLLLMACFYGGGWYFFPLESARLSDRIEFWRSGIQSIQAGHLHGFLRDDCQSESSTGQTGCTCVALIHGLGDEAMTWKKILLWPKADWKRMGLERSLKLFAMDLPASGDSLPLEDASKYRVRVQAEALKKVLSPICSEWVVVGNSLGGWIAAWLALDWPEGVSRLILLDPAGLRSQKAEETHEKSLLLGPTVESMKEFQRRAYFRPRVISERIWKEIVRHAKKGHSNQIAEAQVPEDDLELRLPLLRRPTLLLWGKEDRVIPLSTGHQMRALMPTSIWREVPECGHLPQKECPLPVIQAILDMIHFGAI